MVMYYNSSNIYSLFTYSTMLQRPGVEWIQRRSQRDWHRGWIIHRRPSLELKIQLLLLHEQIVKVSINLHTLHDRSSEKRKIMSVTASFLRLGALLRDNLQMGAFS